MFCVRENLHQQGTQGKVSGQLGLGHIQGLWEEKINKIKIKDKGCCQSSSEQDPASQIFSLDFLPKTFLTVELNNYGLIGH